MKFPRRPEIVFYYTILNLSHSGGFGRRIKNIESGVWDKIKTAQGTKIGRDIGWNLLAFTILGISGILLNALIGRLRGPGALGVFNQAYSVYIVVSQFSVFGLYMSTLKYSVQFHKEPKELRNLTSVALYTGACFSLLLAALFFLLSGNIGRWFDSREVSLAIRYVAPGIVFFSLNKILFSLLNGLREMKAFAKFQSLRYGSILMVAILLMGLGFPGYSLSLCLSLTEAGLFLLLAWHCRSYLTFFPHRFGYWVKTHLGFGARGFLSGAVSEMNTRVDILMLGYFTTDAWVGIYSLPAMIVEGLWQLSVVVRDNINPLLTRFYLDRDFLSLKAMTKKVVRYFYLAMGVVSLVSLLLYPAFLNLFFSSNAFKESFPIFGILLLGLFLSSGFLPLFSSFVQWGYPGIQTIFIFSNLITNIALNFFLIPKFGVYGAAAATGLSWMISVVFLKLFSRKAVGVSI